MHKYQFIGEEDLREAAKISEIVKDIESIDPIAAEKMLDEIFMSQPFLISLLLGYRLDLIKEELDEITKILFVIWRFFNQANVQSRKITAESFEKLQLRNIQMIKFLEGEEKAVDRYATISSDLSQLKSKALFSVVFLRFDTRESLQKLEISKKGMVLLGLKSLIECFEEH